MWKSTVVMMMIVPLMSTGTDIYRRSIIVEADGFGDASSPCKIAAEPFVYFSAMFGTNETWAGPKPSGQKT
jgi:hypothetical protein